MVKDWAGDADREEDGVCEEAGVVLNSLNVAGVDSRDLDFLFGDLFIVLGVAQEVLHAVDSKKAGLRKTALTCFSEIGSLVCSTVEPPRVEAGISTEFTNVSIRAGITG